MQLPDRVDVAAAGRRLIDRPGFFDYERTSSGSGVEEWHVNFADPRLFTAYGSSLLAQDEIQVAEHPALGALREALDASGLRAVTVEQGAPTPVTIRGVERRCSVSTATDAAAGRPQGLYGNAFGRADEETVRQATQRIDPPMITNLIAMASLSPRSGFYTHDQIRYVLSTASTAFRSAASESAAEGFHEVVVHSGFWGCGAFGGNRLLMTTLQSLAAEMAAIESLVIHTGDRSGAHVPDESRKLLSEFGEHGELDTDDLIGRLAGLGFEWGVSDGN